MGSDKCKQRSLYRELGGDVLRSKAEVFSETKAKSDGKSDSSSEPEAEPDTRHDMDNGIPVQYRRIEHWDLGHTFKLDAYSLEGMRRGESRCQLHDLPVEHPQGVPLWRNTALVRREAPTISSLRSDARGKVLLQVSVDRMSPMSVFRAESTGMAGEEPPVELNPVWKRPPVPGTWMLYAKPVKYRPIALLLQFPSACNSGSKGSSIYPHLESMTETRSNPRYAMRAVLGVDLGYEFHLRSLKEPYPIPPASRSRHTPVTQRMCLQVMATSGEKQWLDSYLPSSEDALKEANKALEVKREAFVNAADEGKDTGAGVVGTLSWSYDKDLDAAEQARYDASRRSFMLGVPSHDW